MDSNDDLGSLLLNDQPRTWSEQSEEAFLQNLFATHTLLNDEFHINDNLANLDIANYSSVVLPNVASQSLSDSQPLDENLVTSLEKNLEIIQQQQEQEFKESNLVMNSMTDFDVFNLDTSFNLTV